MLAAAVALSLAGQTPLHHRVELTPERATVGQCEPLLVRVTLTYGRLRPARPAGSSVPHGGFGVETRSPLPAAVWQAAPVWYDGRICLRFPRPMRDGVPGERSVGYRWITSPAGQWGAFAEPGVHQLRATVRLVGADGKEFTLTSPAGTIRVVRRDRAEMNAEAAVRPLLYRRLSFAVGSGGGADELAAALPSLGDGGTASAVRRLLALDAIRGTDDEFAAALAEAERLPAALPPVGRDEFALRVARIVSARAASRAMLSTPSRIFSRAEAFAVWMRITGGRKPRVATASSTQRITS